MPSDNTKPIHRDEDGRFIIESTDDIEAVRKRLAEEGFNPVFETRDLKNAASEFQRRIGERGTW